MFFYAFHKSKGPAGNIHAAGGTDFYDVRDGVTKETANKTLPQLHSILHTSSRPDLAGVQAARVEVAGLAPNWDGVPAYLVLVLQSAQANLQG